MTRNYKTHAELIREAVEELGSAKPNSIMDFIRRKYPDINVKETSFRADIIGCSINHSSSHHYPGMPKFLFYDIEKGTYRLNDERLDNKTELNLLDLVFRFKEVMDSRENTLNSFCKYGVQLEGWLKGEILSFLDAEKGAGRIDNFDREIIVGQGKKKTDINVKLAPDSEIAWIELKHWLIGYQRGTQYNAQFYFGDTTSVGIKPDAEKLSGVSNGSKYLLILTTANPGLKDWSDGVDKFNRKFSPIQLKSLTNPTDFPNFYYLGLLEIFIK